jgi:hypothetical protein
MRRLRDMRCRATSMAALLPPGGPAAPSLAGCKRIDLPD